MSKNKLLKLYLKTILFMLLSVILLYYNYKITTGAVLFLFLIDNVIVFNSFYHKKINEVIKKGVDKDISTIILPIAVVTENGQVVWTNEPFNILTEKKEVIGKNIKSIVVGIELENVFNKKEDQISNQRLKYNQNVFDIQGRKLRNDNEVYGVLYFNNTSDYLNVETKEATMLLEVDNLNEALDTTEEINRPLLVADVERKIYSYANERNAMIKKYDNNKFILSIQDKYINPEIEKKFPILEEISQIKKGNKLEVTLSIGIGRGGATPLDNYNYAKFSKELALGRGGDQVVIKSSDQIKFFGGNTKEVEKRSRVRARVISNALMELIYESKNVFIIGHRNPDMDCFGAALAVSSAVRELGKESHIILKKDTVPIDYFLNELKKDKEYNERFISIDKAKQEISDDTLVIICDVHNRGYVSDLELVEMAKRKVIIDHHRRSADMISGALLNYIEVYASSTSEMVTEIIQYLFDEPKITKTEANGLLAGMYMDTKGFTFKTGVRTFEAASFLRSKGADPIYIKQMFTDSFNEYILISDTIKSAKIDKKNKIAIAVCPGEAGTVIIAKAADELVNISGIEAGFVLSKVKGDIYISGRSIGDINVQTILEDLGGGGHMNIAGAKVSDSTIDDVIVQLNKAIEKQLRKVE